MKLLVATFVTAFATSVLLTPLVRKLARRFDIVDRPDKHRKLHVQATPLGGGVAVLLAFLVAIGVVLAFSDSQRGMIQQNLSFLVGIISSALVICTVGLIDDRFNLRGRQKLFGQVFAASILLASGLVIEKVQMFDLTIDLGLLAVPFTMFWLLGAINALNLLDGMDGLATSVGFVVSLAVSALAMLAGHPSEAFLALAIAGGLAGFLVYNSPPASIFLGDAGSMLIGLVLGALAIRGSLKGPATILLAAPTAIWAIPILDVSMAILRRRLTG
ncbi:MAG: undecaprenyl/decaprenyl-phosphate alpha-N-acetylglucosaminyl 1-phosphate transferase, partial [Planctomycetia bacterium]|nr:undecaprenyl/decaprenyl-phosphate alpha-N-acetylglucosaminyl 1-phosphate transferase [Planctomycetia bacterium]